MAIPHKVWVAAVVVCSLVAVSCSNSEEGSGNGGGDNNSNDGETATVDQPGVTEDEIRVRGVVAATNPFDSNFGDTYNGVDAYFQMINEEEGGIYGRQLVVDEPIDDGLGRNEDAVNELITQDEPFAVMPVASPLFTGADRLVEEGIPTFGWTLSSDWRGNEQQPKANLFGQIGILCIECASPMPPYVAQQAEASKIGLLAYNVAQSADCAGGVEDSFEKYAEPGSPEVVFSDKQLPPLTTNVAAQVSQMKDEGVDMVMTCMDFQGVVTVAREMNRQGLEASQYLLNAYDPRLLTDYPDLFQDSFVLTFFTPFETEDPPEGLTAYLEWIERAGHEANEASMNGWLNAALFVEGLRQAGEDFTREKVIEAINQMDDWTADGLLESVNWTTAHIEPMDPVCESLSRIDGDQFVPVVEEEGMPFVCLEREQQGIPEAEPAE